MAEMKQFGLDIDLDDAVAKSSMNSEEECAMSTRFE